MSSRVERLTAVVAAEEDLYRRLRDLLGREREVLARLDAEELAAIVRTKEEFADEGRLLEQARLGLSREIAESLQVDEAKPRLSTLCRALGNEAAELRQAHNRLVVMIGVARELLEENSVLARDALGQVRGTIQLLGGLVQREPTYDASARSISTLDPQRGVGAAEAGQIVRQSV